MKNVIITVFFTALTISSNANALNSKEVIDKLQKAYETTKTIQATFKQEAVLTSLNKKQYAEGNVFIKKPGKMRWEYKTPEETLIVTNSKKLYFYIPEDNQVITEDIDNIFQSSAPAAFLAGNAKLKERFDIIYDEDTNYSNKDSYRLRLTPKIPQANLTKLVLTINAKNFQIEKSSVHDALGNITTIEFLNRIQNKEISDDIFNFKIPKGAEVITPPKLQ